MRNVLLMTALAVVGTGVCGCAAQGPRQVYIYEAAPGTAWGAHVDWCLANRPGYDPRTNQFIDRDGYPRACR